MSLVDGIQHDVDTMFGDWGDSITIAGTPYAGLYSEEILEVDGMSGFKPSFTVKTSDVSTIAEGASATVTSPLSVLTDKAFVIMLNQELGDGLSRLWLESA